MTQPQPAAPDDAPARGRWPAIAGGAAAVALAGVIGFLFLRPGGSPSASATPTPTVAVSPSPTFNADLLDQRLTVLLLGLDSSQVRRDQGKGVNSDTIMLASVSADQSEITLMSVPRDTVDVPLPDGSTWSQKINAIYSVNGPQAMVDAIESLLQVEVDGYVAIDMDDLSALVDAVGGLRVNPQAPLVDKHLDLDMAAGRQAVDGETALDYVRTRVDSDFIRAARQQEVIVKLVRKLVDPDADIDIAQLLYGLSPSFETDLPLEDLPTLIELARRAETADVTKDVLDPTGGFMKDWGDLGDGRGYILVPDIEAMRAFAAEHLAE